jgi:hypothetical protein
MALTQGTLNKSFVSAIAFLDQREINPNLIDQARDKEFTDIMKLVGRYKPTKVPIYNFFVNNDVFQLATISSISSGNGTAAITVILTAGTSGFARPGDLIRSSNANMVGQVGYVKTVTQASAGDTLVIWSVNNTPLYATGNDTISFFSGAYGEGSSNPPSIKYPQIRYINQVQIFREYDSITDIQKVSRVETIVKGQPYYSVYQHIQKLISLQGQISAAMIAGQQSVTLFSDTNPYLVDSSGNAVQTTMGLDQYATTYGASTAVASIGTLALSDLNNMQDAFLANKAPMEQMGFCGSKARRPWDTFFKNLGSAGVTSVRLIIDGKETNLMVDRVSYGDFDLKLIHLPIINHPQLMSYTVMPDIVGSIYFVPMDKVQVVGGGMEPRLQIRYLEKPHLGGNSFSNGIITETITGMLAPYPTSSTSVLNADWWTNQGLEALGVKHFQKFRIA